MEQEYENDFGRIEGTTLSNSSGLNRAFTIGMLTVVYRELFEAIAVRG